MSARTTRIHKLTVASYCLRRGPQAQGWTGKCKSGHCQCLAEVGIHPLAIGQDRPSRLGPATRRVADGERMNPPGRVARTRQCREAAGTRTTSTWRTVSSRGRTAPGPRYLWARRPWCSTTLLPARHTAGSSLHQREGTPHPEVGTPMDPTSGRAGSHADERPCSSPDFSGQPTRTPPRSRTGVNRRG
jgi:hypothetical protein